jgi:bifunctional DNase/RNase
MAEQPYGRVRLIEMVVESVRVHMLSSQHVVILKESERDRYLPIWIGQSEANAIAMRLQGLSAERPLTHDLLVTSLAALGSTVSRVVVTHVIDGTFHARLYLETPTGDETEVDSRTSDAIAVAVRTGSPIYADERVLDEAGVEPDSTEEGSAEDEERLAVFRDFVNSLDVDLPGHGEIGPGGATPEES